MRGGQARSKRRSNPAPHSLDVFPLVAVEADDRRGENAVLLLPNVLTQDAHGLAEPIRPEQVGGYAAGRLFEHPLHLPVLVRQHFALGGKFANSSRKSPSSSTMVWGPSSALMARQVAATSCVRPTMTCSPMVRIEGDDGVVLAGELIDDGIGQAATVLAHHS